MAHKRGFDTPAAGGAGGAGLVDSVFGRAGNVVAVPGDYDAADVGAVPTARTISTTAPVTGGGDLTANRTIAVSVFVESGASHAAGLVPDPPASAGTVLFLREDATWAEPAGGVGVTDGDKGDITVSGTGTVYTIDNGVVTFAKSADIATDRLVGRDTAGTGVLEALTVTGGVEFSGAGGIRRSALTGDVTATAGSNATTIAAGVVTYAKMQDVASADRVLGRGSAGGAGDVQELTLTAPLSLSGTALTVGAATTSASGVVELATDREDAANVAVQGNDARLDPFVQSGASHATGLVPDPPASSGAVLFLREDATWAVPAGAGGISDGDKGDVTVSGSGTVFTIDAGVVSLAKMANVATDRLLGRDTAGTGIPETLTVGGGVEFSGSGGIQRSALTGDVTASAGGATTTIANGAVTYAKMVDVLASRVVGRGSSAGTGDPEELSLVAPLSIAGTGGLQLVVATATTAAVGVVRLATDRQAIADRAVQGNDARLAPFVASGASHATGVVPDPGASAGTTRFLREDATWATPSELLGAGVELTDDEARAFSIGLAAQDFTTYNTVAGKERVNSHAPLYLIDDGLEGTASGGIERVGGTLFHHWVTSEPILGTQETLTPFQQVTTLADIGKAILAGRFKVGTRLRYSAWGTHPTVAASPQYTMAFRLGTGVTVTGNITPSANNLWKFWGEMIVTALGASGSIKGWTVFQVGAGASTTYQNTLGTTINTTVDLLPTIGVTRTGGAGDTNSIVLEEFHVELFDAPEAE